MNGFITVIHVISCVLLVIVVLMQQSKGDGMGSAFGGGGSATQSVLGGSAANVITKLTTALAVVFMVTSLVLAYFSSRQSSDSLLKTPANAPLEQPDFRSGETGSGTGDKADPSLDGDEPTDAKTPSSEDASDTLDNSSNTLKQTPGGSPENTPMNTSEDGDPATQAPEVKSSETIEKPSSPETNSPADTTIKTLETKAGEMLDGAQDALENATP